MQGPQQSGGDVNRAAAPDQLEDKSRGWNNSISPVNLIKEKSTNLTGTVKEKAAIAADSIKGTADAVIGAARETADEYMGTPKAREGGAAHTSGIGLAGVLSDSTPEVGHREQKPTTTAADARSSYGSLKEKAENAAGELKKRVTEGGQEMEGKAWEMNELAKENQNSGKTVDPAAELINRARGWDTSSSLVESIKEKALHASDVVKEKSLATPEKIKESFQNASGLVQEKAGIFTEWAEETAGAAVKTLEDTATALNDSAAETSREENPRTFGDWVKETAGATVKVVEDTSKALMGSTDDSFENAGNSQSEKQTAGDVSDRKSVV